MKNINSREKMTPQAQHFKHSLQLLGNILVTTGFMLMIYTANLKDYPPTWLVTLSIFLPIIGVTFSNSFELVHLFFNHEEKIEFQKTAKRVLSERSGEIKQEIIILTSLLVLVIISTMVILL